MTFTPDVYERIRAGCQESAVAVVPELVRRFRPESMIDVGGGEGWWARAFRACGCKATVVDESVKGYEDDRDGVTFAPIHLDREFVFPCEPQHAYGLALCLEVAEHLPSASAETLVNLLVAQAPVVVFSAAIPGQGGHGHVNERWPDFWADLFADRGYRCSDDLRWHFWRDETIEPWYRQNLLVFGTGETLTGHGFHVGRPYPVVHPEIFGWYRK